MSHAHPHRHDGLAWALALTLAFALVETAAGVWAGSLALLGDAGHMFTDAAALGLAAFAAWLARRPPTARHTYGFMRAEALAALVNGLIMLIIVTGIAAEAWERLHQPRPVQGGVVLGVAALGLVVNLLVLARLHGHGHDLNVRAALLHVLGDLLGSVAALASGLVILLTGWTPIDPILSLFICLLLLVSSVRVLREAVHEIMAGVPGHLDLPAVRRSLEGFPGVRSVHDLHLWRLSGERIALSAHLVLDDLEHWPELLQGLSRHLEQTYGINHITLQPEPAERARWPRHGHPGCA